MEFEKNITYLLNNRRATQMAMNIRAMTTKMKIIVGSTERVLTGSSGFGPVRDDGNETKKRKNLCYLKTFVIVMFEFILNICSNLFFFYRFQTIFHIF